jgi:AraC-like DNA-binding protein
MLEIVNNLDYKIRVARFQEVNRGWRTAMFLPLYRIIPFTRLYFPLEGLGTATLAGKVYNIEPGKMLLIPPYAKVELKCQRRLIKYWTHFNARAPGTDLDVFSLLSECLETEVKDFQMMRQLFERLVALHFQTDVVPTPLEKLEVDSSLSLLLLDLLRQVAAQEASRLATSGQCFIHLLTHLEKNLYQRLTLRELASAVNLHPTYASNLFKKKMGVSLIHYRNQRRIRAAINYFHNGDYSISEVTDLVGISDISNFTKMFKRYTGHLPLRYKKEIVETEHEALLL